MNTTTLYIEGVHCDSCVKIITEEFLKIKGIKSVSINVLTNKAKIEHIQDTLDIEKLNSLIVPYGYKIVNKIDLTQKFKLKDWIVPFFITIAIITIFISLQRSGLLELFSIDKIENNNLSYFFTFFVGLIASISSCFAVVGSIVIAFNELYKDNYEFNKKRIFYLIRPNLLFHISRLITFFILGGILGLIGGTLSLSGRVIGVYNIIIAIIMLILGLNIIGIFPSLTQLGIKMPNIFTKNLTNLKKSKLPFIPLLLGFLTFFLPCGFTQSMQIFALGSGSFIRGGFSMLFFALGTFPILFITGITAKFSQNTKFFIIRRVGAMLIVAFSIYIFFSGIPLLNFEGNLFNSVKTNIDKNSSEDDNGNYYNSDNSNKSNNTEEIQKVKMSIKYYGFEPEIIKIKKGVKVRWEIYGDEVTGCTNAIIFPYLKQRFRINRKEVNVIEFIPPNKKGYLLFSCWMGMVRGVFIVE